MSAAVTKGISTKTTFSGVSSAATTGQTTTNGSTIVVFLNWSDTQTFVSLTDNKGNAANIAQERGEVVGNGHRSRAFVIKNIAGGAGHTFTATFSANTTGTIFVAETLTADLNAPVDVSFVPELDAVDPFDGSVTTADANTHLIGFCGGDSTSPAETHTEANGFTRYEEEPDGSTRWAGAMFGIIKSATGTYTMAVSDNGSSNAHVHLIAIKGANGPAFTAQPTNQTCAEGGTAGFSGTVQSSGGTPTYQWQMNDGQGAGIVNASGGSGTTTANLTTPTAVRATHAGRLYRLAATDTNGTTYSNWAEWSVTNIPASVSGDGFVMGASYMGEGMMGAPNLANGAMSANGAAQSTGAAAILTAIQAAAAGTAQSTGTAPMTTQVLLQAAGVSISGGGAGMSTSIQGNAAGVSVASGAGNMVTGIVMQAAGSVNAGGNADLTVAKPLAATGAAQATGAGTFTTLIVMSSAGLAQALGNAGLTTAIQAAAAGQAQATGSAGMQTGIAVAGGGAAQASGTADLTAGSGNALAAVGQAVANGSADITVNIRFNAAGLAQALGVANLATGVRLASVGLAVADGQGNITTQIRAQAVGVSLTAGTANLDVAVRFNAAGLAQAIGTGALIAQIQFVAAGQAQASGTADLVSFEPITDTRLHISRGRRRTFRATPGRRKFTARLMRRDCSSGTQDRRFTAPWKWREFRGHA